MTDDKKFFDITVREDNIVWLTRTNIEYQSVEEIEIAYLSILDTLKPHQLSLRMRKLARTTTGKWTFGWLYDVRNAPRARNDAEFENAQAKYTELLLKESSLVCTLCRTQAGVMQISRMAKKHDANWFVTADPDFAVSELTKFLTESA